MTPSIVAAVLFAAVLHAVWNSLAHAVDDRLMGFAMIALVDMVGGGALAACGGLPPAGAWPFIIASALVHVAYNLLLLASYQLGEFSQMYPLARGTSPWVWRCSRWCCWAGRCRSPSLPACWRCRAGSSVWC